ncbi:MAG: hypothetical protein ACM3P0_14280 [Acidobacteriota bacterium]
MSAMYMNQSRSRLWVWVTVIVACLILIAIIIVFVAQPVAVRKMPATSGNPSVTDTASAGGK